MCRWIHLEVNCAEKFSQQFPKTLKTTTLLSPCQAAVQARQDENVGRDALAYAYNCPSFEPNAIRLERIFYTRCDDCVKRAAPNLDEESMEIELKTQRLFRQDLLEKLSKTPYEQFIANICYQEYGIQRRYVWNGSRWLLAPQGSEEDPLGDIPLDNTLEGLQWWINQGLAEQFRDIGDYIFNPIDLTSSASHHSNPPSPGDSPEGSWDFGD
ncbi:hypothetical protein F4779DRAFT_618032 [Xylariaceae sp. FL0662B]|nr:hypothetical protein F4779DRAFT_618032 [Xylariaceae sp. FL0662B]